MPLVLFTTAIAAATSSLQSAPLCPITAVFGASGTPLIPPPPPAAPPSLSPNPSGGAGMNDLAVDMGLDPETAALLRQVAARKEMCVANEDFELAKRLKTLQEQIK